MQSETGYTTVNIGTIIKSVRLAADKYRVRSYFIYALYMAYLDNHKRTDNYISSKYFSIAVNLSDVSPVLSKLKHFDLITHSLGAVKLTDKGIELVKYIDQQCERQYKIYYGQPLD